jgi:hypothetical protein
MTTSTPAALPAVVTTLEGMVAQVNGYGFALQGRASWLHISKFCVPPLAAPHRGERIVAGLDRDGFVRTIEVLGTEPVEEVAPMSVTAVEPDRDRRILRQAVLNSAISLLSAVGDIGEVAEVLEVAEQFERWVLRDTTAPPTERTA